MNNKKIEIVTIQNKIDTLSDQIGSILDLMCTASDAVDIKTINV